MEFYSVEIAKKIVIRLKSKAEYNSAVRSARCPLCGAWGILSNGNVKKGASGVTRRYFDCPDCGYRFVAEEAHAE